MEPRFAVYESGDTMPTDNRLTSEQFASKVSEDRAASFWLQRAIATSKERDVLDALIDAEALAAYCGLRAGEAGLKFSVAS